MNTDSTSHRAPLPNPSRLRVDSWPKLRAWRLAIHSAQLTPRAKLLGLLIADHVNHARDWQAWPAQSTLANMSGDGGDRRHVRDKLDELISASWLTTTSPGGPRRSARYALTLPTGTESVPVRPSMGTESVAADGTDSVPSTATGTDAVPADGTNAVPADGTELVPRSSMTTVRECIEASTASASQPTPGAAPARAHARPVAPASYEDRDVTSYVAWLDGKTH